MAALVLAAVLAMPAPAGPTTQPAAPAIDDGPQYKVSQFALSYGREQPEHPPIASVMDLPIVLGKTDEGYVAPRAGVTEVTVRLTDFKGPEPQTLFASAIRRINESIVEAYNGLPLVQERLRRWLARKQGLTNGRRCDILKISVPACLQRRRLGQRAVRNGGPDSTRCPPSEYAPQGLVAVSPVRAYTISCAGRAMTQRYQEEGIC